MIYAENVVENKLVGITKSKSIAESLNFKYSFKEENIEQSYDGAWYIKGYAPNKCIEELIKEKRDIRNNAINVILWRIDRYNQQKKLNIETTDSEEEYLNILKYIQYLRDIPQQLQFPNIDILTYDDWKINNYNNE